MTSKTRDNGRYVIRDVEPHIPTVPTLWTEIAKKVDRWAPKSIKRALEVLADRGDCRSLTLTDDHGFSRSLYWRDAA